MSDTAVEDLLILTKTYPSPSSRHRETTCVAAMNRDGALRRVFPVPFRLLDGEQQFQKWEWIRAQVKLPSNDRRPESRREYNTDWEAAFRLKYETDFATKDLIFMMGTVHRFPDQWLIIGVLYPPLPASPPPQLLLEI